LSRDAHTFDRRLFLVYIVGSLAAIFYLPTLVPMHPSTSMSYVFGYNNSAGIALLLLLVAIGTVWTRGLNLQLRTTGVSKPVPVKILIVSLVAMMCGCVAMYVFAGRFGGFGESSYEIDRIWLVSQGKIPYIDFEWPFGVALLYCPLFLQHLLPITLVQAYYLFWTLCTLLGTLLLFTIVNRIDFPTNSKKPIFLLFFVSGLFAILCMGTHYTALRYDFPLFFILVIHKLLESETARSRMLAIIAAVSFTVILLLISPEVAVAHAFACVCLFTLLALRPKASSVAMFAVLLLSLALVFVAAIKFHEFDTAKSSGGGADSFPIAFSPHILYLFVTLFVCACYVYRRFSDPRIKDNTIGLIAYSIPMLAAALGRCDSGHVASNGTAIFLVGMFYLSNDKAAWKLQKSAFVVVLILLPALAVTLLYTRSIQKAWTADFTSTGLAGSDRIDLTVLYPSWHGMFLAPFGYKPNGLGSYLSDRVDYGHFEGFENANTPAAISQKLAEIRNHPEEALLLPDHFERNCQIDPQGERVLLSVLFTFPYFGNAVHPASIEKPFCDFILANYSQQQSVSTQNFDYGLWIANELHQ
jgi:hypothetical protein